MDLHEHTRRVFEKRYGKRLSDEDVERIIRAARCFLETLR